MNLTELQAKCCELAALQEKATPGEWKICYDGQIDGANGTCVCIFNWDSFKEFNEDEEIKATAKIIKLSRSFPFAEMEDALKNKVMVSKNGIAFTKLDNDNAITWLSDIEKEIRRYHDSLMATPDNPTEPLSYEEMPCIIKEFLKKYDKIFQERDTLAENVMQERKNVQQLMQERDQLRAEVSSLKNELNKAKPKEYLDDMTGY